MKRSTAGRGSIRGSMLMSASGPDTNLSGVMWGVLSSVGAWHTPGRGGNWDSRHRDTELCVGVSDEVIMDWWTLSATSGSDWHWPPSSRGRERMVMEWCVTRMTMLSKLTISDTSSIPCSSCHLGLSVWGAGGESLGTCCLCPAFLQGVQEFRYHYHCCLWHDAGMKTQALMGFWQSSIHSHHPLNVHLLSLAPPGRHQDNPFGNPGLGLASVW